MTLTLLEYFMEKSGKKPDEISPQEYQALNICLEYMIADNKEELEKFKKEKFL